MRVLLQICLAVLFACGCTDEQPPSGQVPDARDRAPARGLPVTGMSPLSRPAAEKPPKAYCNVDTVFAEPELGQCKRLTVIVSGEVANWPKGEMEKAFKEQFARVFADQAVTFVEGAGAGNESTPPGEKSVPAVDATVSLESYAKQVAQPGPDSIDARPTVLTVAIVDAKTGIVLASVVVTDEYSEASASDMCEKAVKALKTELEKARSR